MSRLSISAHEVAHCVAIQGLTAGHVRYAEVVGSHRGATHHTGLRTTGDALVSCISGVIGERILLGSGNLTTAGDDWNMARLAIALERDCRAEDVGDIEMTVEYRDAERRVRAYFLPRVDVMRALAHRLHADGRLDGVDVRDALAMHDARDLQARRAALARYASSGSVEQRARFAA